MKPLTQNELIDLEEAIIERLEKLLRQKNDEGSLEQMLRAMELDDIIAQLEGVDNPLMTWPDGHVLVLGAIPRMVEDLRGVGRSLGIEKRRFEFIEYDDVTNHNFRNIAYSSKYCAIIAGSNPHSARGMAGDSSIITHIENHRDMFPEVKRVSANGSLKITKTNFRRALEELIDRGIIMPNSEAA